VTIVGATLGLMGAVPTSNDCRPSKVKAAAVPYPSGETFDRDSRTNEVVHAPKRAYYDACAFSDDRLFALFMGRAIPEGSRVPRGSGFVHVFDLDGALQRVLVLDRPVNALASDRSGRTLYAISSGDAVVVRFRVP
jgi:hypothetical protein